MDDAVIQIQGVSKKFRINANKSLKEILVNRGRTRAHIQEFYALRDVDVSVGAGSTLGLIGHNGSGKSTLLKIVGGILTPDTGQVLRKGRLAALLELGAGFSGDLTGRENVYLNASILGISRKQVDEYFDAIVDFSGIEQFIDTQVKFYSSGMYVRLAFAVAVHVDPDVLLVDEVLAVGDEQFQRKCLDRIQSFQRDGRTIVFVTHGLDLARELCDRVVLLDHGVVQFDGDPVGAVRMIRDTWEGQIEEERERLQAETGTRSMRITDVATVDGAGAPVTNLTPDVSMGIEFTVTSPGFCDDWVVGVAIENQFDQLCFGSNTDLMGMDLGAISGSRRVRFLFPALPLSQGNYHVTVAVHGRHGPEYHRLNRVGQFRLVDDRVQDGPVRLTPVVHVDPLQS